MSKTSIKNMVVAVVIAVVVSIFSGCNLHPFEKPADNHKEKVKFEGLVICYEEPDLNSKVKATFSDGLETEYDNTVQIGGVQWIETEYGWIVLHGNDTVYNDVEEIEPREAFVTARLLNVRSAPGTASEKVAQLPRGTQVVITETSRDSEGLWGKAEQGWVYIGHLYFPGEVGENTGFAVVREKGAKVYDTIVDGRQVIAEIDACDRIEVLEQIQLANGTLWIFAGGGWINGSDVYVEGAEGKRPCTGIVVDTTPLNVRMGPGTDYEINTSLPNGTYVVVLERITRKKHDWGFVGNGWIYMDNVDTEAYIASDEYQVTSESIVGKWQDIEWLDQEGTTVSMWHFASWEFKADGTFKFQGMLGYYQWKEANEHNMEKLGEETGMNDYTYSGTYTFDGEKLKLIYTASDDPQMPAMPHTEIMMLRAVTTDNYKDDTWIESLEFVNNGVVIRDWRDSITLCRGDDPFHAVAILSYGP